MRFYDGETLEVDTAVFPRPLQFKDLNFYGKNYDTKIGHFFQTFVVLKLHYWALSKAQPLSSCKY